MIENVIALFVIALGVWVIGILFTRWLLKDK